MIVTPTSIYQNRSVSFILPRPLRRQSNKLGLNALRFRDFSGAQCACTWVKSRFIPRAMRRVMQGFSSSFLIFFYQVALGGLFALAVTPFHELERAFYKSTGGDFFAIGLFSLWGKSPFYLDRVSNDLTLVVTAEILFYLVFKISFSCYLLSLWDKMQE